MPLPKRVPASIHQVDDIRRVLASLRAPDRPTNIVIAEALIIVADIFAADVSDPRRSKPETVFLYGRLSASLNILRAMGQLPTQLYAFATDPLAASGPRAA